jgi:hypothetical protein
MILSGCLVHWNGRELAVVSARKKLDDGSEDAAFELLPAQFGEEALNGIEP